MGIWAIWYKGLLLLIVIQLVRDFHFCCFFPCGTHLLISGMVSISVKFAVRRAAAWGY